MIWDDEGTTHPWAEYGRAVLIGLGVLLTLAGIACVLFAGAIAALILKEIQ